MFTFLPCGVFMRAIYTAFFSLSLSLLSATAFASGDHDHDHDKTHDHQSNTTPSQHTKDQHHEHEDEAHDHREPETESEHTDHEHDHTESVTIDAVTARQFNIQTAPASSGFVMSTQRVFGKVVNDASQISHIGARFDGTIIQVNVSVGQTVKKGDKLARIESNQSLHPYYVKAPFDGMIIERHANPGELTQDQPLFTLFNDNILWAEFKIFPNQMRIIKQGQKVIIDEEVFNIAHIIPNQNNEPFELARVRLDNHDHGWRAGVTLKADVITQSKTAHIRIPNDALQQFENKTVVFIKQGHTYEPSPVKIGLRDNQFSEILSGLNKGDEYVVKNSYLIKADLEKSGAEHVH